MKGRQRGGAAPSGDGRGSVFAVALMASFLTPFMSSAVIVALPSIGTELGAGTLALGWVSTAFLLSAAMFLVPFGRLADIHGRPRVFIAGAALLTASLAAALAVPSLPWLIALRAVQGLGGALIFGTSTAMLSDAFPLARRGRVLGMSVAVTYAGLSLGPFLGGILTQAFGWRSLFVCGAVLGAAMLLLAALGLDARPKETGGQRLDLPGSAVFGASLVALMYGFSALPSMLGVVLAVAGLGGLAGFVSWELHAPDPVLDMTHFRKNTVFLFSNLAALVNYSATFAVSFLLSLYLQYSRGMGPGEAGLVLVSQPLVQAVFSPLAGRLSDRVPARIPASAGMGLTAAGLVLLALVRPGTGLVYVAASLGVVGLGFAFFSSPNTNAVMGSVEQSSFGVASSVLATMRLVGQMLSMGLVMLVFSLTGAGAQSAGATPEFFRGLRVVFLLSAALCAAGVFASLARGAGSGRAGAEGVPG